jgi:hypothetical protein
MPKDIPMKGLRRNDDAMKLYRWYQNHYSYNPSNSLEEMQPVANLKIPPSQNQQFPIYS